MLKKLCPNHYLHSIYSIQKSTLKNNNIKGIIIDLDNTIVPWDVNYLDDKIVNWFSILKKEGFKLCIVSNNNKKRVESFSKTLQIPSVSKAIKPRKKAFLKGMDILDTKPYETAVIGDQIFTDILGGNRLGLYTILVIPMSKKELNWTKVMRYFERKIIKYLVLNKKLKKPDIIKDD